MIGPVDILCSLPCFGRSGIDIDIAIHSILSLFARLKQTFMEFLHVILAISGHQTIAFFAAS
jgi:hypothetical protein